VLQIRSFISAVSSFPLEQFILKAKIVIVEILSAIVFFKRRLKAFLKEMRR
jgi:hypothetical protein